MHQNTFQFTVCVFFLAAQFTMIFLSSYEIYQLNVFFSYIWCIDKTYPYYGRQGNLLEPVAGCARTL